MLVVVMQSCVRGGAPTNTMAFIRPDETKAVLPHYREEHWQEAGVLDTDHLGAFGEAIKETIGVGRYCIFTAFPEGSGPTATLPDQPDA